MIKQMYSCFFYSVCSRTIFRDIPIITIFDRISLIIMVTTSIPVGTNVVGEGPWLAPLPGDHLAGLPRIRTQRNLECAECLKRNHNCWNKSFLWFGLSIQTNPCCCSSLFQIRSCHIWQTLFCIFFFSTKMYNSSAQGWAGIPVSHDSQEYKPQISRPFPSRGILNFPFPFPGKVLDGNLDGKYYHYLQFCE